MNSWKTTTLLLLITGLLISSCTNPGIEAKARDDHSSLPRFKKGDKICFIGNSITHGGTYHAFLQIFCATRFPDASVEYYNCGIAGDVADGMLSRLNDVQRGLYFKGEADEETIVKRKNALDNYYVKTEKLATLRIDNTEVGMFTQKELEEGVNLADYSNTPQYRQALQVSELCFKYQQIQNQLRSIAFVEYRMLNTYEGPNTIEIQAGN